MQQPLEAGIIQKKKHLTLKYITSMQEENSAVVTMFVYYYFQSLISPCCPVTVNRGELSRSDYVCVL